MSFTLLPPVFVIALPPPGHHQLSLVALLFCATLAVNEAPSIKSTHRCLIAAVSQFWTTVVVTQGLTTARQGSNTHRLLYLTHRDEFEKEKKGVPPSLGSQSHGF